MFRYTVLLIVAILPTAFNQFITFKDGKIGVNFAGFNAEAGLGGLVTGNAAHGGLSASAGTPFGQRAGAGIGGTVDNGQAKGGGYAGASAGYGLGASSAIGGKVDKHGSAGGEGSEAHIGGLSTKTVILTQSPQQKSQQSTFIKEKEFSKGVTYVDQRSSFTNEGPEKPSVEQQLPAVIPSGQRFYKRKYFRRLYGAGRRNRVNIDQRFDEGNDVVEGKTKVNENYGGVSSGAITYTATKQFQPNPNFFNDIFNIPISTLNAVSQFLSNGANSGGYAVSKTKTVEHS